MHAEHLLCRMSIDLMRLGLVVTEAASDKLAATHGALLASTLIMFATFLESEQSKGSKLMSKMKTGTGEKSACVLALRKIVSWIHTTHYSVSI